MVKLAGNWKSGPAAPKASPACNLATADSIACPQCLPDARSAIGMQAGGQATVEYTIVAGVLIGLVAIMSLLLTTFGDYGERILELIASDYP